MALNLGGEGEKRGGRKAVSMGKGKAEDEDEAVTKGSELHGERVIAGKAKSRIRSDESGYIGVLPNVLDDLKKPPIRLGGRRLPGDARRRVRLQGKL